MEENETKYIKIKLNFCPALIQSLYIQYPALPMLEQNIKAKQYLDMLLILQYYYKNLQK